MSRIRVVRSPLSPVYSENQYRDEPNSQAIFTIKLANGLLVTNSKDFLKIPELDDSDESEANLENKEEST